MPVGGRRRGHGGGVVDGALDDLWGIEGWLATTCEDAQRRGRGEGDRDNDVRGPGGSRLLRLVAWKDVICVMLGLKADLDSWLRTAAEDSSDGPMDREAGAVKAAVCRSRDERTADAIFTVNKAETDGLVCVFVTRQTRPEVSCCRRSSRLVLMPQSRLPSPDRKQKW